MEGDEDILMLLDSEVAGPSHFSKYRNPRCESIATIESSRCSSVDTIGEGELCNPLSWIKRSNYMYVTNIDERFVISSNHDKEIVMAIIHDKILPSTWDRIKKLINANHTRNGALENKLVLSERNYVFLLAIIRAVGSDFFTKICEFLKEKVGFNTVIESIYTSYEIFGSACNSIFGAKWENLLDENAKEISTICYF